MNQDGKRPVTLEDLLRLKRAERPPAEFWNQFDRELRAKQLAALVEKRPWWRTISLPRVFAGVRRYHLPLGATAVLAVTILSVREYRVPKSALPSEPARAVRSDSVSFASVVSPIESVYTEPTVPVVAATDETSPASSRVGMGSDAIPSDNTAQMSTLAGPASRADGSTATLSPSIRSITENFTALQADEPVLSRQLLSPARGFETRALPSRSKPVEPLAQMKVPAGSRRSNLIASATLATTTVPVLTSERSARGLSDERLYETVSRVNARGAGMLVKF